MRSTLILLGAALASTPAALALLPKERPNLIPPGPKLPLRRSSAVLVDKRQLNETEPLEPTEGVTVTNTRSSATATRTGTATTGFATASTTRTGTATSTATASVSQGPCAVFYSASSSTLFSPAEARECMQAVPLDEEAKANTLEAISKMYDLAIFEYNQLDTPDPLAQKVDIRAEISRMQSASYDSDYAFSHDLSKTIDSLNDGHHYWSDCYGSSFLSFIPFPPVALNDDPASADAAKIYVAPDSAEIMDQYEQYFYIEDYYNGLNLRASDLAGKEITAINGQAPWDFIDSIANTEGNTYQSLQARRTNALAGRSLVGVTTARTLGTVAQQSWPERDNITYTIGGQDYTIPYVTRDVTQYTFSTPSTFHSRVCLAATSSSSSSGSFSVKSKMTPETRHPLALFPEEEEMKMAKRQYSSSCEAPSRPYLSIGNDPRDSSAYLGGTDVQFYLLPQNASDSGRVGVIWLATFSPESGCTNQFISDTEDGFANFTSAGVKKVIIDTTGNGGGSIALSIIWQSLFAGSSYTADLNFQSVMRNSPLAKKFVAAHTKSSSMSEGYYGPEQYRQADGTKYLSSNVDYLNNGKDLTVNGKTLAVSSILRDSLPSSSYLSSSATGLYAPSDVLIFGDGLCGSACASWSTFLVRYLNVSTAVYHPRPGEATEFQNFEAGQAVTNTAIESELELTSLTGDSDAPPALLMDAKFGFAFRGHLVPGTSDQFIQYTPSPAGSTIGLTKEFYLNPLAMWSYVAANGPLSSSPKLATTGGSSGGGTATASGGTVGGSSSGGSSSSPTSDGYASVGAAQGFVVAGAAVVAASFLL